MRRRLEVALPLLVFVGFMVTAVLVNQLLGDAQKKGIDALEDAIATEANAIASTQDRRIDSQIDAAQGFFSEGSPIRFDLAIGSTTDGATLEELLGSLTSGLESGYYLVNEDGLLTQGYLLEDPGSIGKPFEWPAFEETIAALGFDGGVLPVSTGLTTGQPASALIFPLGPTSGAGGYFVFESPVTPESDFNKEIASLRRGETGEFLFFDNMGTVIAANDPSLVAERIPDEQLLTAPLGIQKMGDHVVVLSEVPSAGWRVAFRQDVEEFERPLAQPVESVGRILILVLLGAGFLLTVLLYRRLQNARSEQDRLQHLNDAQQELISIVSHELRTPVAGVLGFLETSLDHWDTMDDAERRRAVGRAATNARRLQAMTRDVLDTQTVESGRLVHVMEPLDLVAEVRTAVEASTDLDPERTIEVSAPDEPVMISGDADRLQQVLNNLLDNARKSSPAVEPIEVAVEVRDGLAEVAVVDHGAGIEREALERIFEKFVRGRDEGVTGTGLGLYISRQIVDAHGGRIWAESDGAGATFRFALPVQAGVSAAQPEVATTD